MIKAYTAFTSELDDKKQAVGQIMAQLECCGGLLTNTIGIVACHYEFVLSDIYKAICDALPFEIVGTISSAQSVHGGLGSLLLSLYVMTSDDVAFDKVLTPPLTDEPMQVINDSYKSACRSEKPSLILVYAPFMLQNSGDDYVKVLTDASGGAPCFGTLAIDDTLDFVNCFMLADGEHYRDRMAMILVYGDVKPRFYVANISEDRIIGKSAVVTKSAGPVLMEVNERPIIDYFSDLGLVKVSEVQYALAALPFLLDYNDGSPKVSKIFVTLTPEKYAICAGSMPMGSTLYMATTDKDDVIYTTNASIDMIINEIDGPGQELEQEQCTGQEPGPGPGQEQRQVPAQSPGASALLIYSCISRSMTLGSEQYKELELIDTKINNRIPFLAANSGGEICPTHISNDMAINRFHNNAFIACLL